MRPISIIILVCISQLAFSQANWYYTNYQYNLQTINPAFVGFENKQTFDFLYRNTRIDASGSPKLIFLGHQSKANQHGFGATLRSESVGVHSNNSINLLYNYSILVDETNSIYIGTALRRNIHSSDLNSLFNEEDPPFNNNVTNKFNEVDLGVAFSTKNFTLGLNASNLLTNYEKPEFGLTIESVRRYSLYSHYDLVLIKNILKIRPILFYEKTNLNWRLDAQLLIEALEIIQVGFMLETYENGNNPVVYAGLKVLDYLLIYGTLYDRDQYQSEYFREGLSLELGLKFFIPN